MNERIKLSKIAEKLEISELEEQIPVSELAAMSGLDESKLKHETLPPLVWFYILSNAVICVLVFGFAVIELIFNKFGTRLINDKVIIALISGNTLQLASMIIAAFKGLFSRTSD